MRLVQLAVAALLVAFTAEAQELDLAALRAAQAALQDKARADAMLAIDPKTINSIEVRVTQNRPPGPLEGASEGPITFFLRPGDTAFKAVLSAIKGEAEVKVEKAQEALEATGVVIPVAPPPEEPAAPVEEEAPN